MNKVGLSLSVLSLCWFISIDGWAGQFYYNNSNTLTQKPTAQPVPPVSTTPSTGSTTPSTGSTTPSTGSTTSQSSSCVSQKITTTDSNGNVTTTDVPCNNQPSNGSNESSGRRINY
ncbi:hypothetical protein THII_2608 [Thioploca ingrica]|uniref:Uncharacterized protein n=1 Tax=Thioploca ingrica TaxID=40754 RepID=A0A090ANG2_9GAMM|nr:hypothetical protein THII_2608 [Thioploca ingrica]